MEALILSMGTGGGHNAAAQAIKEELERRGHVTEFINPYTLESSFLARFVDNAYIKTVTSTPKLFGLVYKIGDAVAKLPCRSPIYFANRKPAKALKKHLEENHYDAIITTHLFAGEMLTALRDDGTKLPKTIFIATDYTCIPFEAEVKTDAIIAPSKEHVSEFARKGLSLDSIYGYGIPTSAKFSEKASKEDLKKELELDPAFRYLLVCGGSMGAGHLKKIVRILEEWCHHEGHTKLIVVCGNNNKLFEQLFAIYGNDIILYRFTDKMPELFKLCEVCFTKPGGLSSTEAAAAGIPIAHITPIPGCETINMNYFSSRGMSLKVDPNKKSIYSTLEYLGDRQHRLDMIKRQHEIINPNAASDICSLAEKLVASLDTENQNN
ncbi:MAG: hypothetical protein LUH23_06925 [Oscillospiraceae bacterium]|nr:hypothetical protein [Oscillospiraceae bacterium]